MCTLTQQYRRARGVMALRPATPEILFGACPEKPTKEKKKQERKYKTQNGNFWCSICKTFRQPSHFWKGGFTCKDCEIERQKQYKKKNNLVLEVKRREKRRFDSITRVTQAQLEAFLKEKSSVCAVTGQPTPTPTIVRADPSRALTTDNLAVVCKSRILELSAAGWSIGRLSNPPIPKKRRRR